MANITTHPHPKKGNRSAMNFLAVFTIPASELGGASGRPGGGGGGGGYPERRPRTNLTETTHTILIMNATQLSIATPRSPPVS